MGIDPAIDMDGAERIVRQMHRTAERTIQAGICLRKCANKKLSGKCKACFSWSNFKEPK